MFVFLVIGEGALGLLGYLSPKGLYLQFSWIWVFRVKGQGEAKAS